MTYAVVWSENGGAPHVGRLELASGSVDLVAGTRRELRYDEMAATRIDRGPTSRLAGRPTLVIENRVGDSFRIASLDGAGALHELSERLDAARHPRGLR